MTTYAFSSLKYCAEAMRWGSALPAEGSGFLQFVAYAFAAVTRQLGKVAKLELRLCCDLTATALTRTTALLGPLLTLPMGNRGRGHF